MRSEGLTEGERWAQDQLRTLREERFSPLALVRFLVASQRRANATRTARPALARQEALLIGAGAAAYVAAGHRRALRWWAGVALMLDWHLGMAETEAGEPRPLGPADALTLLRAWLVPLVAARPEPGLVATGQLTDVLDGRLARASKPTRLGRDLEGLADACFTAAVLRALVRTGALPGGAAAAELLRITGGVAATTAGWLARDEPPERALLGAARLAAPVRAAGMLTAAAGGRRAGAALVVAGAAAAAAAHAAALQRAVARPRPAQ